MRVEQDHIQCLQKQTPPLCCKKWQPCKQHEKLKEPFPENRTGSAAWEQCLRVQHRWWDSETKNIPLYKNNNHKTLQAMKSVSLCNDKVWHYTEEEEEEEADHFKDQVTACCSWKSKWLKEKHNWCMSLLTIIQKFLNLERHWPKKCPFFPQTY